MYWFKSSPSALELITEIISFQASPETDESTLLRVDMVTVITSSGLVLHPAQGLACRFHEERERERERNIARKWRDASGRLVVHPIVYIENWWTWPNSLQFRCQLSPSAS